MAGKRMIKSEMFLDEKVMLLNFTERLLWIGIIASADDEGRLRASSLSLKARIFPADEISLKCIEESLYKIDQIGLIKCYQIDNQKYAQIKNWDKHQWIRKDRFTKSGIPPLSTNCQPTVNQSHAEVKLNEVKEKEVKEREGKEGKTCQSQNPPIRGKSELQEDKEVVERLKRIGYERKD